MLLYDAGTTPSCVVTSNAAYLGCGCPGSSKHARIRTQEAALLAELPPKTASGVQACIMQAGNSAAHLASGQREQASAGHDNLRGASQLRTGRRLAPTTRPERPHLALGSPRKKNVVKCHMCIREATARQALTICLAQPVRSARRLHSRVCDASGRSVGTEVQGGALDA